MDRRAFLAAAARYATLGGLATVAAVLGRRARGGAAHVCPRQGVCSGCESLPTCILPPAESRRRAGGVS